MMMEINKDNYQQEVIDNPTPTVVDFWGPKCVRCLELMPTIEKMAEKYKGQMRLIKLDTTQNKRLCMGLRLMSLPAFIFYRDGQEVERISGQNISEDDLINAVKKFVGMEEK